MSTKNGFKKKDWNEKYFMLMDVHDDVVDEMVTYNEEGNL